MVKHIKKAALLLIIFQFISASTRAQGQDGGGFENRKLLYGLYLGFTENKVDIYHSDAESDAFYAPGFRVAVMADLRLGRYFSLRAMPGMSIYGREEDYKVGGVFAELPIEMKFHPFRVDKWRPYLCSGINYSFDLNSLGKDIEGIQRLNAHDFRYICGIGADFDTRYVRLGVELKVDCFSLIPTNTVGAHPDTFFLNNGPSFSIGINIEG